MAGGMKRESDKESAVTKLNRMSRKGPFHWPHWKSSVFPDWRVGRSQDGEPTSLPCSRRLEEGVVQ